jgi:hypothetical protein
MKLFKIPILLIVLLASCREEYYPKVKSAEQSLLVVEGLLNSGPGATNIKLTRTFNLNDTASLQPEIGARVVVESQGGTSFTLDDRFGDGNYYNDYLPLDPAEQYRLHISMATGKEYVSDFISVKKTPVIDSISWERNDEGMQIYVSTHDPANATQYYKWDYDETWEINSAYFSKYKVVNGNVIERSPDEYVFKCWRYANAPTFNIGSSAKLQADVIYKNPLLLIPKASEKLSVRYSILVKQFALDKKGYEFYQLMKKNTESLGSIFDAQPSEMHGNIHNLSNPDELVVGYITASTIEEKRIFIDYRDAGQDWGFSLPCQSTNVANNQDSINLYFPYLLLPYEAVRFCLSITHYQSSSPSCIDCTLRRGSTERPYFW